MSGMRVWLGFGGLCLQGSRRLWAGEGGEEGGEEGGGEGGGEGGEEGGWYLLDMSLGCVYAFVYASVLFGAAVVGVVLDLDLFNVVWWTRGI